MIKIGIDGRALTGRYTGDRTYWLNLLREYAKFPGEFEFVVYSRLPFPVGILTQCPHIQFRELFAPNDRVWTLATFPKALKADGIQLAHTQYTTPLRSSCPVITTVHDISFKLFPEWFPRKHRMLLNFTVPGAMRRAAHVITDSESSRDDILRVYRMDAHRVTAIHLAANEEFVPLTKLRASQLETEKYGICDPFVLSVGVLQPRKNLGLLVRAFAAIKSQTSLPHKLVLTGKAGWGTENLDGLLNQLGISEHVILTGYVPDEDLPMLYSAASVLAYPSMYEGFGLPPVESMSCGTPVLVSDAPCMPEIAGEGGWVLPARDPKPWTQAMIDLLSSDDLQSKWSGRGLKRAKDFSWETTAKKTMDVYRNILK